MSKIERGNLNYRLQISKQRKRLIGQKPSKQQLFSIYHLIMNQRNFTYKACQAFVYQFRCCLACRNRSSVKKIARKDYYLNKGIEKLEKHLDVGSLIRRSQMSEVIKNVLFDEDQQFLIKYQKPEVIDSGSSTSTSDQSDDPREHEDDILGRVCKENKASRSQVKTFHANVKRRLMQYEGQRISHRHRRILQGILSTHFSNKEKIKAQEFKLKREKDKLKNSEK